MLFLWGFGHFFVLFHDGFCQFFIKHEPFGETRQLDFTEYTPLVSHLIYSFLHLLSVADLMCLLWFQEMGELYSFGLLLPVALKYTHENVNEYWLLSVRTTRLPIHFLWLHLQSRSLDGFRYILVICYTQFNVRYLNVHLGRYSQYQCALPPNRGQPKNWFFPLLLCLWRWTYCNQFHQKKLMRALHAHHRGWPHPIWIC